MINSWQKLREWIKWTEKNELKCGWYLLIKTNNENEK